ncbi:hypothetical protein [Candidatus Roseilinea sp. NK_OTU-006]|nr:hypothetical protein [Candidatus Roseilinea sp. NK_OTU-006]
MSHFQELHTPSDLPPNGTELSRAAEGGVGWSELLGSETIALPPVLRLE